MQKYAKLALLTILMVAFGIVAARSDEQAQVVAASGPAAPPASIVSPTPTPHYGIPTNPDPRYRAPDIPKLPQGKVYGEPALRPSNPNAAPGSPTFSDQDVRAQIMGAGHWTSIFQPNGPVTVTSVEFLTPDQVAARINQPFLPHMAGDLLCLVKLTGSFTRQAADPGGIGPNSQPVTSAHLYLAFDARTGNRVLTYQPAGAMDK